MEAEEQRDEFLGLLPGRVSSSLLDNLLAGKGPIAIGDGVTWAGEEKIRAGTAAMSQRRGHDY